MRILIHAALGMLFLGMSVGCLHSPPVGATRGIVEIRNLQMFRDSKLNKGDGVLTGVVIGEHTVLTAAHTFVYEPEQGHPLRIDGREMDYTILADGWKGNRDEEKMKISEYDLKMIDSDYLLLRSEEPFEDIAELVPLTIEGVDEIRHATLVTRSIETDELVAIPLRRVLVEKKQDFLLTKLSPKEIDSHYLSGSPVIGEYSDGTLVLVGIATASGEATAIVHGVSMDMKNRIFITPAYRIPFEEFTE